MKRAAVWVYGFAAVRSAIRFEMSSEAGDGSSSSVAVMLAEMVGRAASPA
jgi:hypothetical protein